ncbi:hypothetical protein GCM10009557_74710 [Virgisporangium ochraceum]|jgi:hypothetical protein|uniref:Chitinase n=1 Tax=Virgisporangium ochraceum TaxID=65505 RepID=A0A8J4A8R0_9ACTN|nr:hypothetical protein [Virgisporangium ochraceum]GIJ75021.1 hypothetical protein Voc01_099380 [Virgisporangium ochraceum]
MRSITARIAKVAVAALLGLALASTSATALASNNAPTGDGVTLACCYPWDTVGPA